MKELSKFVKWSVAGDGYVGYASHNKNAHYSISRIPKYRDYLETIADKFSGLQDCNVTLSEYTRKDNGKEVVNLRTSSHPLFSRIRERQYIGNHRVIEPHMLTVIDEEALAFLYIDDGSLTHNNKGSRIVRISTCAYSYPEQQALVDVLSKRFNVDCSINKASRNLWQLNVLRDSQDQMFGIIEKYIPESYGYKLP